MKCFVPRVTRDVLELHTRILALGIFIYGAVGADIVLIYPLHFPSTKHFCAIDKQNK